MAVYEWRCAEHGSILRVYAMGDAPATVACECGVDAARVFGNFNFQEDRYRFFKNGVDGGTFSYALGMDHPDNRRDYNAVTSALGCEPVTRGTLPAAWKEDQQYAEHVRHGGDRLDRDGHKPAAGKVTVLDQLKKSNVRV